MARYGQTTLGGYRTALAKRGYALVGTQQVPTTANGGKKVDVEKTKNLIEKIGAALKKVGNLVGGVRQTRFINRTLEVFNIIKAAGYDAIDDGFTIYKLRKTQVKNNKGNYADEFKRLFAYTVDTLNMNNPGMGTYWGEVYPFKMDGQGQIHDLSIDKMKEIINRFPPGTWQGEEIFYADAIPADSNQAPPADPLQQLTQKVVGTYTVLHDAAGVVKQIKDAAGNIINPSSPQYDQAIDDIDNQRPQQAGVSPWVVGGALLLFAGTYLYLGKTQKKKETKTAA